MDYVKVITQFKATKDKEAFAKKHITTEYVPYAEKLTEALEISKRGTHIVVNEKEIYKKNSPTIRYLSMIRIISLYTDIEYQPDKSLEMYDALSKNGLMVLLLSSIPETELSEFMSLVDMCVNDIYENERDITAIVESKAEAIRLGANQLLNSMTNAFSQENIKELFETKLKEYSETNAKTEVTNK